MSYEKQTWVTGETITAEKLNHIESGVEDAEPYMVNVSLSGQTITSVDKTYNEIKAAIDAGKLVVANILEDGGPYGTFHLHASMVYDLISQTKIVFQNVCFPTYSGYNELSVRQVRISNDLQTGEDSYEYIEKRTQLSWWT